MSNLKANRFPWYLAVLAGTVLLSILVFLLSYQYDNKYTWPVHPSGNGVLRLEAPLFHQRPLLFLTDDWEIYDGKLLTPEEIATQSPNAFGKPEQARDATYRMTLFAEEEIKRYALELPARMAGAQVWVNGQFLQQTSRHYVSESSVLPFEAGEQIEIVIAAPAQESIHPHSPIVFGSADLIKEIVRFRQLLRGMLCGAVLAMTILCLVLCVEQRFSVSALMGAVLGICVFFALLSAALPADMLAGSLRGLWWLGYLLLFPVMIVLHGQICSMPRWLWIPMALIVSASSILLRLRFGADSMGPVFSGPAVLLVWGSMLYLLAGTVFALLRNCPYAKTLLFPLCVSIVALAMDQLLPQYEPIRSVWRFEAAALVLLLGFVVVLWQERTTVLRDNLMIAEKGRFSDLQLKSQREKVRMQQQFFDTMQLRVHEIRSRADLMQLQLINGQFDELNQQLQELSDTPYENDIKVYSGHELLNVILTTFFSSAETVGTKVDYTIQGIPRRLSVEDRDLAGILINLLDNALESCQKVPADHRWIRLSIRYYNGLFAVECHNATLKPPVVRLGNLISSKEDQSLHGYGLRVVHSIVERYNGALNITYDEESFSVYAGLNLNGDGKDKLPPS